MGTRWDVWLAQSVEHLTLDLGFVSSSPTLSVQIGFKKSKGKKKEWEQDKKGVEGVGHIVSVLAVKEVMFFAYAQSSQPITLILFRDIEKLTKKEKKTWLWTSNVKANHVLALLTL